ncbi:MAG: hypothetical protein JW996_06975 [Candidatus Cloacimonetes bacterium]|nr:hypothetical protein [Candidatus Cloacimonadota bacterium]
MTRNRMFGLLSAFILTAMLLFTGSCDDRTFKYPEYDISIISVEPDTIYADNNITFSNIQALVKDEDGFGVTGETVTFRTNVGTILKNIVTDSTGIATTTLWDSGEIGLAIVEAFINDVSATCNVTIEPTPPVENLTLIVNSTELNVGELTIVKAKAEYGSGNVPDGTIIVFETDFGTFRTIDGVDLGNVVQIATTNGIAQTNFYSGTQSGEATVSANIGGLEETKEITIHPGSPRFMYLFPDTTVVAANSGQSVQILAQVEDRFHNSVRQGVGVEFTTTLGSVNEFASTDDDGLALTVFSPGITAGQAVIEAVADSATASTVISVISDDVHALVFGFQGQVDIQVQGTGGQESYELVVNLYDMSGNPVDEDMWVWFELLNAPEGTNINNVGIADSTMSNNGQAIVSINSGYEPGIVRVKAYTFTTAGMMISVEKSNIVVHAGPPNSAAFNIGGHDTGEDMGSGLWKVQVSALITDAYGNPVDAYTAAYFSLPDDPDFVTIEAAAYVGNENAQGDTLAGTAYTYLIYDGAYTNEEVNILVEVGGIETFPGTLVLPIQFPAMDIVAVPMHLDWVTPNDNAPKDTEVRVTVKDGQNNPIDNQIVVFSTTLGTPIAPTPPDTGDPYTGLTGVVDGEHGRLNKIIRFQKYECPAPGPGGPGSTQATITAQILGTGVSANVTVLLFRYTD